MSALTGTVTLARLALRRDRIVLPLWIFWLTVVPVNFAAVFPALYPTREQREIFAAASGGNAALVALYGPIHDSSIGALLAWRVSIIGLIVGLISMLTVIRHTRTEEDAGRRELLGACVVGRHAGLAAVLIVAWGANLLLAALITAGLAAQGLPIAGSLALGLSFAAAGCVFAAVGAVTAQLTESAGAARGLGLTALAVAFVLRLGGDTSAASGGGLGWLSWLSPLGRAMQVRPFAGDRWWLLAPLAALTAALAATAVRLNSVRDLGAGVLPTRLGPATGAPGLGSALGLAWRLQRGLLIGWLAGFAVLGLILGGVADAIGGLMADNPTLEQIFARLGGEQALVDAYLAAMAGLYGILASGYAVQAVLRLRAEESSQRSEPVLATAVSRLGWAGGHLVFAVLGPAAALAVAGAVTGVVYGATVGDVGAAVPKVLGATLIQVPAVWVIGAVAVALTGLLPKAAAASWAAVGGAVLFGLFGAALDLPQAVLDVSPFTHVPRIPGAALTVAPLLWLLGVAAGLSVAGLVGLRRRDMPVA